MGLIQLDHDWKEHKTGAILTLAEQGIKQFRDSKYQEWCVETRMQPIMGVPWEYAHLVLVNIELLKNWGSFKQGQVFSVNSVQHGSDNWLQYEVNTPGGYILVPATLVKESVIDPIVAATHISNEAVTSTKMLEEAGSAEPVKVNGSWVGDRLRSAAGIYDERNALYGDNYKRFGHIMQHLFPEGLALKTPDEWNRIGVFIQAVAKKTRYAAQFLKGGHEDSLDDDAVYSMMLQELDFEIRNRPQTIKVTTPKA